MGTASAATAFSSSSVPWICRARAEPRCRDVFALRVSLRNQFAERREIAVQIISSVSEELSAVTVAAKATEARGELASELASEIETLALDAAGPDEWA
jgi:hypothetical protein